jgi:hypothetical protein
MVDHPCGTIKRWLDHGYLLPRGRAKVRGDMSLTGLVSNVKRVIKIIGVQELIAAVGSRA